MTASLELVGAQGLALKVIRLVAVLAVALLGGTIQPGSAQQLSTEASGSASPDDPAWLDAGRDAPVAGGVRDLARLTAPIDFDGLVDDAAWNAVPPLPLTMYEPVFRGETERRIWVKVAYDDDALYVAARFYHDDPSNIRAFSLTRDTWNSDDGFGIFLDTFLDKENAVRFIALPLGARMDMTITGDGQGERGSGGPRGVSWNTFWDLETEFLADGWSGEMRIPFESLRFETDADGSVVMGLMAYAYEPGNEDRWTFPAIPRSAPYTQVSAFQNVRLEGIESRNPVFVSPYALAGRARTHAADAVAGQWPSEINAAREMGVDLKFNPTPNLTLDVTANTDFAAVEADQQQVNLTRFSLFFDEKRPFFQERAGIFQFATGADRGTLFYSRRIGLANGQPVPILGGARLVGRIGEWDVGAIEMVTDEHGGLPRENFGVLRVRRRVLNPTSFVGAMVTSRVGGGQYNHTWGVDGQWRAWGNEYLTLKLLQTVQGGSALASQGIASGLDAGRLVFDWTRRQQAGLSYQNVFVWSGPGYDPGVGFEARQDFTRAQSDWNYQWFPGEGATFRRIWLGARSSMWMRNANDEVETGVVEPFLHLETTVGTTFIARLRGQYEDVLAGFDLSDAASVPVGSYWAREAEAEFRAPRGWAVRPNVTVTAGEFFDGRRVRVNTSFDWPLSAHLGLRGGWEWNRVRFDERGQAFDATLLRLTSRFALDTHLSVEVFGQYNSLADQLTTNSRLRYNFREGQDLWLVWNEGLNLERDPLGVPRLPLSDTRTLTLKYTHTFIW
jgi:hypothetical protein